MGTCPWVIILVTVASLLDPTFADVLVQPGYDQPAQAPRNTVDQSQFGENQAIGNAPQNYFPQENPSTHLLQQQHALQQQYLQHQHQQEKNQLLQLQQHQLRNPAMHQRQVGGNEMVGTVWGLPPPLMIPGPFGALQGGRLFSLGPFGLNSLTLGGLGGLGPPLLLSPHQPPQMTESTQFEKSVDGQTQPRVKRDNRDAGDSADRKYRQKIARPQQNGVATNPAVKSKPDATAPNPRTGKKNDEIVGSTNKGNEETVGSSLLDPLGLMDKAEGLVDDLKSGHLPNPLDGLSQGLLPGFPGYLNKANPGSSQFEEHVVGQSQQYRYPAQYKSNNEYTPMNQQRSQPQGPVVGDIRQMQYPYRPPPPPTGQYDYGAYQQPYPYQPLGSSWMRRSDSMNNQGNGMSYRGNPVIGAQNPGFHQYSEQTNRANLMSGSENPATVNSAMKKLSGSNSNGYQKTAGGQDAIVGKAQVAEQEKGDPIIRAPNPANLSPKQSYRGNPAGYDQMVGGPNPMGNFYQNPKAFQPMRGTLYNPLTGSSAPAQWNGDGTPFDYGPGSAGGQTPVFGDPLMNSFYDQGRQNYYGFNDGQQRHRHFPLDIDEIFDNGYNNHHHHLPGGFNRIYENLIEETPFGFGNGNPYFAPNHYPYML